MSGSSAPQQDAAPCSPSDVASLKLLRYLQERVKQLRVENNTCSLGLSPAHTVPGELSGSYLTTVRSLFSFLVLGGFFSPDCLSFNGTISCSKRGGEQLSPPFRSKKSHICRLTDLFLCFCVWIQYI